MLLVPPPPKFIFLTGVDGVGKTVLSGWLSAFCQKQGLHVRTVWSRFNNYTSKPLLAITRLTGHNRYKTIAGKKVGFHDFQRLFGYREVFAFLQMIDVNVATWLKIKRAFPCDIVIAERGPWDTLVDVMADTNLSYLPQTWLGKLYTVQIPNSVEMLLIDRTYDKIIHTRPELIHDIQLQTRLQYYRTLGEQQGWTIIDNNGSFESTQSQILKTLHLNQ